jgi:copper(I)-binding protein
MITSYSGKFVAFGVFGRAVVVAVGSFGVAAGCASESAAYFSADKEIAVFNVVAPAPVNVGNPADATMAVYATYMNRGALSDTLVAIESPVARVAGIHATVTRGGMSTMAPTDTVPAPAGAPGFLAPGETHAMLEGLPRMFVAGDSVPVTFVFRRAGRVAAYARVVRYEELEKYYRPTRSKP